MRSPSSPGALVSQEKFPGNVGFPPRQVAIYRNEVNAAPAGRELEGGGNNYVHGEGTGPDQALVPANSSRHLPGAGRDLWGLSAAVAEGDPALQAMKMLVRPSRPPRGASLLQTAGQVFLQVLWSARSWWRGEPGEPSCPPGRCSSSGRGDGNAPSPSAAAGSPGTRSGGGTAGERVRHGASPARAVCAAAAGGGPGRASAAPSAPQ